METTYDKRKKFIVNAIYILLILLIIYAVLKYALQLVSPFIIAFIIAYLLTKPAKFISKRLKLPYKIVAILLVLLFYSTIGLLISIVSVKLITSLTDIIMQLPIIYETQFAPFMTSSFANIEDAIYRIDPGLVQVFNDGVTNVTQSLGNNISNISMSVVGTISNIASSLPGFLIKMLLTIISTVFIAADFDMLTQFVVKQFSPKMNSFMDRIKHYIIDTLFVVIRSYALIMTITFCELSIGLSILQIPNAIYLALMIAVFDILPVLGTGGVMIPWTIITFIQGDFKLGIGLLITYVVITVIRNIIEPKIVGSQLGLHPVITLMSMFIGANLFGVIGLFGFPITLSLLRHLNDSKTIKLFK